MSEAEALRCLQRAVEDYPTAKIAAAAFGVSPQYLSDVLRGRRDPAGMLRRYGMIRIVSYEWPPERGDG